MSLRAYESDADEWITVKAACAELRLGRACVMELTEEIDPVSHKPYLTVWRPSRGVIWLLAASVAAHKAATRDPDFWPLRDRLSSATPKERQRILQMLGTVPARALQAR